MTAGKSSPAISAHIRRQAGDLVGGIEHAKVVLGGQHRLRLPPQSPCQSRRRWDRMRGQGRHFESQGAILAGNDQLAAVAQKANRPRVRPQALQHQVTRR